MALPSILKLPVRDRLRRGLPNKGTLQEFLTHISLDTVKWEDDFLGDTLHGGYQTATSGTGAAALAITAPTAAARHGIATMVSGTDDDGYSGASLGLQYYGEHGAVFAAILSINTITTSKIEMGFTDVTAGTDAGAVNVLATPTFNATDWAGWVRDTDDTALWQATGVINGVAATKVEPTNLGDRGQDAIPTADVRELLIVALSDGAARFYRGDMDDGTTNMARALTVTYDSGWQPSFLTNTVALTPWLFVQSRAGSASRTLTIDYWGTWQYRFLDE